MRLFMSLLLSLFIISLPLAQNAANVKVTNYQISGFSNDSLKATPWFPLGDYEGLSVLIKTAVKDSSDFAVVFQRGNIDGSSIVSKRPGMLVDTFNTLTAANFQSAGSWINSMVGDSDLVQALDSMQLSGYVFMVHQLQTYRAPYGRFFIKGLTSNKKTAYDVFFTINQTKAQIINTQGN